MLTPMAPNYANLFMDNIEHNLLRTYFQSHNISNNLNVTVLQKKFKTAAARP